MGGDFGEQESDESGSSDGVIPLNQELDIIMDPGGEGPIIIPEE